MPVRDLTDRPRVPRLGKIRLGDKSGTNGAPKAQPYFVVPPEIVQYVGEKPTELRIVFLDDDEEAIFSQYYRLYNASHGRVCRGDGFKADALLDAEVLKERGGDVTAPLPRDVWAHGGTRGRTATQNVVRQEIECLGAGYEGKPACVMYGAEGCSVKGFLQYALRDVPQIGVWQTDTGSVIALGNLNGLIHHLKNLLGGRIAGVPLILKRTSTQVQRPPDMRKTTVWTLSLEVDPSAPPSKLLEITTRPRILSILPPVDESDVDGLDDEGEGLAGLAHHVVLTGPVVPPQPEDDAEPRQRRVAVAPTDLLRQIEQHHGIEAKLQAIDVMVRCFDTAVITRLSLDEHADYADMLTARLEKREHDHDMAYSANGKAFCAVCGDAMDEKLAGQPAMPFAN